MHLSAAQIAQVCHEANRAVQQVTGDPAPSPHWEQAPAWQKDSAETGVRYAWDGATPEQLHQTWVADKYRGGWVYGPLKCATARTHPCLVPYADLPPEQRLKDALFYAITHALTPDMPQG